MAIQQKKHYKFAIDCQRIFGTWPKCHSKCIQSAPCSELQGLNTCVDCTQKTSKQYQLQIQRSFPSMHTFDYYYHLQKILQETITVTELHLAFNLISKTQGLFTIYNNFLTIIEQQLIYNKLRCAKYNLWQWQSTDTGSK